jgi:putative tryptophan/tyrosine transport system substrate-binding protein
MKKLLSLSLAATMLASMVGCSSTSTTSTTSSSSTSKTYKVAIVKQLDHASLDEIADAITAELDAISEKEGVTIEYGEVYSGQNDQTTLQQIGTQVVNDGVDVIIPIATLAAQTMTVASDGAIPVVYAAISDPESAELTDIDYVTGTSDALNTEQIMEMILAADPDTKTVGLLYSKSEANSEKPIEEAKEYLDKKGIKYIEATGNTDDEVKQAAASLIASGVDAVFTPTDNVVMAAELSIAQDFAEAGIPHYTGADSFVRNGAFATCGVNYTDLGKETADLAYKAITEGIDATGYAGSYEVMPGGIITVNSETSEKVGIKSDVFKDFGEVTEVETTED